MATRGRTGALAACLGVLVLCTAAGTSGEPSGGGRAPDPAQASEPAPASAGGGSQAPEPPAPPPLEPVAAQPAPPEPQAAQGQPEPTPPPTTPTQPEPEQPPLQQEQEFQIDVPTGHRKPKPRSTPMIPALRPTSTIRPSAGRLAMTGVDARLLAALGTFMIGMGLTLLGITLPRRV